MGRIDNLNDSPVVRMQQQVRKQGTKSPLGRTSVSEGTTEFIGLLSLLVSGSGKVTGTWIVDGELEGDGTLTWTGPVNLKGTTRFEGDTTQVGPFHVQGATDLTGDLAVKSGGKITVEGSIPAVLGVTPSGLPGLQMGAGSVYGAPAGLVLAGGTSGFIISNSGTIAIGPLDAGGALINSGITTNSGTANVLVNPTTFRFYVVSSATKYKTLINDANLPPGLIDIPVRDWVDIAEAARCRDQWLAQRPLSEADQAEWDALRLRRIPGVIAEEVEAAGGQQFVTYGPSGEPESVAYDRLAIAQVQILRDEMRAEIAALRAEVAELRNR